MYYLQGFVSERSPDIRQRILDHSEDGCRATRVLLDGIQILAPATAAGSIFVSVNNLRAMICRISEDDEVDSYLETPGGVHVPTVPLTALPLSSVTLSADTKAREGPLKVRRRFAL